MFVSLKDLSRSHFTSLVDSIKPKRSVTCFVKRKGRVAGLFSLFFFIIENLNPSFEGEFKNQIYELKCPLLIIYITLKVGAVHKKLIFLNE